MKRATATIVLAAFVWIAAAAGQTNVLPGKTAVWTADLNEVRRVATMIPGELPLRINVVKFAESLRSKKFSVKGAADEPSIQARTAFQVVYRDGTVMVDAGMSQRVHKYFGRGVEEPYDPEQAKYLEEALLKARMIVFTHEHGDHVAGVIDTPLAETLAPKSILTRAQLQTLLTQPQMPEIRLTPELAKRYIVLDYEKYFPLAPGFVLIKAPGHTAGSQMIYVKLQSGKEYLLSGDVAWHMDNIRLLAGKDAPWITENEDFIMAELQWLNELSKTEKNLYIVVSHDEQQRLDYVKRGILGSKLE
jgi:glyoxylase-like metal-dependent hydrolase (beta-lactamase superfamily II)